MSAAAIALPGASSETALSTNPNGLTSNGAASLLQKDGPNAMPDTSAYPLRNAFAKF
jgi:hypothetical protein